MTEEIMKTSNRQQGQTLIETAIILVVLLVIVLGITEFSRGWFTKNSIKNAVRTGARVGAVTGGITAENRTNFQQNSWNISTCATLNGNDRIFCYMYTSPGIRDKTNPLPQISISIEDVNSNGPDAGDIITTRLTKKYKNFFPKFPNSWGFGAITDTLTDSASMRYEL
jgi:hypothetical protein